MLSTRVGGAARWRRPAVPRGRAPAAVPGQGACSRWSGA